MVHKNKETGRMADSTFKEVFGAYLPDADQAGAIGGAVVTALRLLAKCFLWSGLRAVCRACPAV